MNDRTTLSLPAYVIITPARNEAHSLEQTIQCVIAQTERPLKWVIVSDGSTDGTDEIATRYAAEHDWIELLRMPERRERHFAGKVHAFAAGLSRVQHLPFEVLASLDADLTFDNDYFAFLLEKIAADPLLGLVGTPFRELTGESYDYRFVSIEHVSGACQVFRRDCFASIGGYVPVKGGGIDHIAVISARMKGWKTRTYTEKHTLHHRKMGSAQGGVVAAKFRLGVKDYAVGNHPLWEAFRSVYQIIHKPIVVGGLALGAGYVWSALRRNERPVPKELTAFHRREQMQRLRRFFRRGGSAPAGPGGESNSESIRHAGRA